MNFRTAERPGSQSKYAEVLVAVYATIGTRDAVFVSMDSKTLSGFRVAWRERYAGVKLCSKRIDEETALWAARREVAS
jgi:hypothetical protein